MRVERADFEPQQHRLGQCSGMTPEGRVRAEREATARDPSLHALRLDRLPPPVCYGFSNTIGTVTDDPRLSVTVRGLIPAAFVLC